MLYLLTSAKLSRHNSTYLVGTELLNRVDLILSTNNCIVNTLETSNINSSKLLHDENLNTINVH